jgi:hypothetical protein
MVSKKIIIYSISVIVFALVAMLMISPRSCSSAKSKVRSAFAYIGIVDKKPLPRKGYVKLKNDSYTLHRKVAANMGLKPIKNDNEVDKMLKKGSLVKVKNKTGYKINKLTHSKPVLALEAYDLLKSIGASFRKQAGWNYFVVTSLTRTMDDQKKLSKKDINATPNISTHSYGISFDISYVRFNGEKKENPHLKSVLVSVLYAYQKEKKIYIIEERTSSCFHITVRK